VAHPGAALHDPTTAAGRGEHRFTLRVGTAEQRGDRDVERTGQPGERGQAARGRGILDLRKHRLGDPDPQRHLADGESGVQPQPPDLDRDRALQLALGRSRPVDLPRGRAVIDALAPQPVGLAHVPSLPVLARHAHWGVSLDRGALSSGGPTQRGGR
jgi:hypothetical protein